MIKRIAYILMVLVMSLSVLGCGAKETAAPVTDTPDGDVNGSAVEDVAEEPTESTSVSLPLPAYKYTGNEEYIAQINDYLIDYYEDLIDLTKNELEIKEAKICSSV